jgi:hypothetical protein
MRAIGSSLSLYLTVFIASMVKGGCTSLCLRTNSLAVSPTLPPLTTARTNQVPGSAGCSGCGALGSAALALGAITLS